MIAALSGFWNHRYEDMTFEGRVLERLTTLLVDEKGGDSEEAPIGHNRSLAMTPLE
jgi:hypothetical protein